MGYLQDLEDELAAAKKASESFTVEVIEKDDNHIVTRDSRGTVREDMLGGSAPQYLQTNAPVPAPEIPLCDRPVAKEVGKLLRANDEGREMKLVSGTIRTDLR